MFATTTMMSSPPLLLPSLSTICHAACLPGDTSKECIGVYKVPIDDAVLPYVGTPEALQRFAPDIKYVPPIEAPKSYQEALKVLQNQREIVAMVQPQIVSGKLEDAGIELLQILPKLTTNGRYVVNNIERSTKQQQKTSEASIASSSSSIINDLRLEKLQEQFDLTTGLLGQVDVMIGQGLRGEMGVPAVAQLQIIDTLKDATCAYDDFLASIASATK